MKVEEGMFQIANTESNELMASTFLFTYLVLKNTYCDESIALNYVWVSLIH